MVKRFFSYILVAFLELMSYLPLAVLFIISDFLYFVIYQIIGYRKSVVRLNLRNSFPKKTEGELRTIERKYYKHMSDLFVEIVKYRTISRQEIRKRCKIVNPEFFKEHHLLHKSFICIQGHYGNWEWTPHIDDMLNQKVLSVYKPLHNEVEDEFMIRLRERFGAMAVSKNHIIRVLARREKAGELSAVGLLSDQVPHITKMTYWMTFLNQDTPMFLGAEKMAKMFDLPVVFAYARKIKRGYYEIEFMLITNNPKETKPYEITERHVKLTEQMIKKTPEYWIWSHKRWKRKRGDA